MTERWWDVNEYGCWCPSCGDLLDHDPEAEITREECRQCGFPDDHEKMMEYFT